MIHDNIIRNNTHKIEIPLADSVRTLIIDFLKDGSKKRFSEIAKAIGKKDNVVNRELKELIQRGFLIKSDGYKLDLTKESVQEYIKKAASLPHANWNFQEIRTDAYTLNKAASDYFGREIDFYSDGEGEVPGLLLQMAMESKKKQAKELLPQIKIYVEAEQKESLSELDKACIFSPLEFVEIANLINSIKRRMGEDEQNKKIKLIISYEP